MGGTRYWEDIRATIVEKMVADGIWRVEQGGFIEAEVAAAIEELRVELELAALKAVMEFVARLPSSGKPKASPFIDPGELAWALAELELAPPVDKDKVMRQRRRLAARIHPDRSSDPEATKKMQQINRAYGLIRQAMGW